MYNDMTERDNAIIADACKLIASYVNALEQILEKDFKDGENVKQRNLKNLATGKSILISLGMYPEDRGALVDAIRFIAEFYRGYMEVQKMAMDELPKKIAKEKSLRMNAAKITPKKILYNKTLELFKMAKQRNPKVTAYSFANNEKNITALEDYCTEIKYDWQSTDKVRLIQRWLTTTTP